MTYYLQTITTLLTTAGYTNVFYDYDNPSVEERIFLQNTGGEQMQANVPNQVFYNPELYRLKL